MNSKRRSSSLDVELVAEVLILEDVRSLDAMHVWLVSVSRVVTHLLHTVSSCLTLALYDI